MAKLRLMVLPGIPHHFTQRGSRRSQTSFEGGDYALYLGLLADTAGRYGKTYKGVIAPATSIRTFTPAFARVTGAMA
jgi:hypothetical protein